MRWKSSFKLKLEEMRILREGMLKEQHRQTSRKCTAREGEGGVTGEVRPETAGPPRA